ncbi:BON domain-containing protein [uncultured Thiodictyon sp.]|uniref:BON domain-containing protein n=1 Tax=uncultured Thiodictyon sp. TaxID=1846217 RepID=UPI0025FA7C74|nr:BON domain-containing protein [uncultured Thiodictyon sp.]
MRLSLKGLAVVILPVCLLTTVNLARAEAGAAQNAGQAIDQAVDRAGVAMDATKDAAGEKAEQVGDYLSDAAITTKIKTEILADPLLKVFEVHVITTDGAVTLSGEVDSQQSIDRCKEIANSVKSVKSVTSTLVVKGGK